MAITAIVTFLIQKIGGLPPGTPGAGNTRWARALIDMAGEQVYTSRSRPIPDAGGDFNLFPGENIPWGLVRGLDNSDRVNITIEIWEDHGDQAPVNPFSFQFAFTGPWDRIAWGSVLKLGSGPTLDVLVLVKTFNMTNVASAARANKQKGVSATLAITKGFYLEIASIDGLYKPDPAAAPPNPGSKPVKGYLSRDNLGRIFTNRTPDGKWARDKQYIEVTLKITAFGGAVFPGGAKAHWNLVDDDDQTNDDPNFHRDWGRYVDPNDYDATGQPWGAKALDNAAAYSPGNADEDLLMGAGAKGTARWAPGPGGEAVSPIDRTRAFTTLTIVSATEATTSVRIHCPNVLGTNFTLAVLMDGVPDSQVFSNAITGTMTMWSRIDVEVVRMAGAFSVAGAIVNVPPSFVPVCVQIDFQLERVVGGALDKLTIAPDDPSEEPGSVAWLTDPSVFTRMNQPGWFFFGGARMASPLAPPGPKQKPTYEGTSYKFGTDVYPGTTEQYATVEVPGDSSAGAFLVIEWTDGANQREASFSVIQAKFVKAKGKTTLLLFGNDVNPLFEGWNSDGSIKHATESAVYFFPQSQRASRDSNVSPGGFGVPSAGAKITIYRPGVATLTDGISPPVTDPAGNQYFAGRTILFTSAYGQGSPPAPKPNFDAIVTRTIVHEFTHAFGMPHKCGYWDWGTPRQHTCPLNYWNTWLIDVTGPTPRLLSGFDGKMGYDLCGRHLMEVRRVHLERNLGLKW